MEIKTENGIITTTMSLAEAFLEKEIIDQMSKEQQEQASKEIHARLNEICSYPYQPERSKREDILSIDEYHKRCAYGPYYDAVL